MADEESGFPPEEVTSRDPSLEDLVALCCELNRAGAKYLVVGGFAIRAAGYGRHTGDIDLVIDVSRENEAKVLKVLEGLPDQAAKELKVGEVDQYIVVRVCDEITVDLMAKASGIDYAEAAKSIVHSPAPTCYGA